MGGGDEIKREGLEPITNYAENAVFCFQARNICFNPLSANPTKFSNTQTILWQFADELFECV